jgi:outer membrane protein assembly factor BamB
VQPPAYGRTAAFASAIAIAAVPAALAADWPLPNGDLSSTRSLTTSRIAPGTVGKLVERWRYRIRGKGTDFGSVTATPIVVGRTIYLQTWKSDVVALDRRTGRVRWARTTTARNDGPNGVAVAGGRLFAATDTTAFALDARTGRQLWARRLTDRDEQFVDIAPVVDRDRVYFSTVGFPPGGRGAVYALRAGTGKQVWRFDTIAKPWPHPDAGGGGAWNPVSVDADGRVYVGVANPGPWGGSKRFPNGGVFRGSTLYTDALVVLDGATGGVAWHEQVLAHDVRDYDFHVSPVLADVAGRRLVVGAGKAGNVIAWDRGTAKRVWERSVGRHQNDTGPLPRRKVLVCPGLLGGVLTPMAYAAGSLYVPVVDLCMRESGITSESVLQRPASDGTGILYSLDAATGRVRWTKRFGSPLFGCATVARGVVFAPTFDGTVRALSTRTGAVLWRTRLRAGINSCPAVVDDLLLVGAGAPRADGRKGEAELVAYGLPSGKQAR